MKNKKKLINEMKNEIENLICTENNDNYEPWNILDLNFVDKEYAFKFVYSVGNWSNYFYYISNIGRVMVIKENKENIQQEITNAKYFKDNNCWIIPIKNGYLNKTKLDDYPEVKLTTTTDIYKFMIEAGWLEGEDKNLAEKIVNFNVKNGKYDRIEVHHIDNNPNNNCIDNLIWVPKSKHQKLHKKCYI